MTSIEQLSLNQATVKRLTLLETSQLCARNDIRGIGLWRDRVAEVGVAAAAATVRAHDLTVTSLCRGGFFTAIDSEARRAAIEDTRQALHDAADLGAPTLVLVSGGLPDASRDIAAARSMIADGIGTLADEAGRLGVRLGIEALHPLFCSDRCVVSSLREALELAEHWPEDQVGVVVDTYHLWWDAGIGDDIVRAGNRIVSYQVSDWTVPLPADALLGRAHVGDGVIDFPTITGFVEKAGYQGFVEVEIFNEQIWSAPAQETADLVRSRFAKHVAQ